MESHPPRNEGALRSVETSSSERRKSVSGLAGEDTAQRKCLQLSSERTTISDRCGSRSERQAHRKAPRGGQCTVLRSVAQISRDRRTVRSSVRFQDRSMLFAVAVHAANRSRSAAAIGLQMARFSSPAVASLRRPASLFVWAESSLQVPQPGAGMQLYFSCLSSLTVWCWARCATRCRTNDDSKMGVTDQRLAQLPPWNRRGTATRGGQHTSMHTWSLFSSSPLPCAARFVCFPDDSVLIGCE